MIGCELSNSLLSGFTKVLMANLEGDEWNLVEEELLAQHDDLAIRTMYLPFMQHLWTQLDPPLHVLRVHKD